MLEKEVLMKNTIY